HMAHGDEMDACDDESGGAEKSGKSGKSSKKKSISIGSSLKVTMCHKPPGNPGNMHTIIIGMPARATHLGHGDAEGECENDVITGPGDPVSFEISDDARIVYSSRALKSLGNVIEQVKLEEGGITVRRTAEAPRKLTQVLRDY
ncbi:MAG: hypothetical protein HKN17_04505, partial [Rhodothermales bacterium]|nr:hypothetical protein [Rhodothermales bacterium]